MYERLDGSAEVNGAAETDAGELSSAAAETALRQVGGLVDNARIVEWLNDWESKHEMAREARQPR